MKMCLQNILQKFVLKMFVVLENPNTVPISLNFLQNHQLGLRQNSADIFNFSVLAEVDIRYPNCLYYYIVIRGISGDV